MAITVRNNLARHPHEAPLREAPDMAPTNVNETPRATRASFLKLPPRRTQPRLAHAGNPTRAVNRPGGRPWTLGSHTLVRVTLNAPKRLNGLLFPAHAELTYDARGNLVAADHAGIMKVKGITVGPCWDGRCTGTMRPRHDMTFYTNGSVATVYPMLDAYLRGIVCARQKAIRFYPNGRLRSATLARRTRVQGVWFMEKSEIMLHPNGRVAAGMLARAAWICGIRCARGKVELHDNGRVKRAILRHNQRLGGIRCARGTEVVLDARGRVISAQLNGMQEIDGVRCSDGSRIERHINGQLKSVTLAEDQAFDGVTYSRGALAFYANGLVERGVLARDALIGGIHCAAGLPAIERYPNGVLKSATLASAQRICGIRLPKGSTVRFGPHGRPLTVVYNRDMTIDGTRYRAHRTYAFPSRGTRGQS